MISPNITTSTNYESPASLYAIFSILKKKGHLDLQARRTIRSIAKNWCTAGNLLVDKIAVSDQVASLALLKFLELQTLHFYGLASPITGAHEHLKTLTSYKNLVELKFENMNSITDTHLKYLMPLTQLRELSFIDCPNVVGSGMRSIASLCKLQRLKMTAQCPVELARYEALKVIQSLPSLHTLDFGPLTSYQAETLVDNRCLHLTQLILNNGFREGDAEKKKSMRDGNELSGPLVIIAEQFDEQIANAELETLNLDNLRSTMIPYQKYLSAFSKLVSLDITDLMATAGSYRLLGDLTGLTSLRVFADRSFDELDPLSQLENLQSLTFKSNKGVVVNFNWLLMKKIAHLDLDIYMPSPQFISSLIKLQSLKALKFKSASLLRNCDFRVFSGLTALETLTFGQKPNSDNFQIDVDQIQTGQPPFPSLSNLALLDAHITREQLPYFEALTNLKRLDLLKSSINGADLDRLKEQRPQLTILAPEEFSED